MQPRHDHGRRSRHAAVTLALTVLAALLTPAGPAIAGPMDPALCARPVLYTLVGSGQSGGSKEMEEVVRVTRQQAGSALIVVPIPYPAVPWTRYVSMIGVAPTIYGILDSEQVGVDRLLTAALRALSGCPGRTLLMAGYSQGADVVSRAVRTLAPSQQARVSVALLGNPSFLPGLRGNAGSGSRTGKSGLWPSLRRPHFRLPLTVRPRTFDACLANDAICNFALPDAPALATGRSSHFAYVKTGLAAEAARAMWRTRAPHVPNPRGGGGTPAPAPGPVGTVLPVAPPPAAPPAPAPPPVAPNTYAETAGGAANTWTNYTNAGGTQGPTVSAGQTIQIACKLTGFRVANGNTWWYRIASGPWDNNFYVSADAFYNNGATGGSLVGTPFVDPAVPNC